MRKKIYISILVFVSLILARTSFADKMYGNIAADLMPVEGGLFHVTGRYDHKSPYERNSDQKLAFASVDVGGLAPLAISDSFTFGLGARYYLHHIRFSGVTNYYNKSGINLHDVSVSVNGIIFPGSDWFLDMNFTPMVASDLHDINWRDFQFTGYILAGWAFNDSSAFLFGVRADKAFWRYLPYPLMGLVIRSEDSFFDAEAILPQYIRVNFKLSRIVTVFAKGVYEGFVWNMGKEGPVDKHYLKLADSLVGAGVRIKIIDGLLFEALIGGEPYRKILYTDALGNNYTTRIKPGFCAETSLVLTPEIF